jgi:hypothetical protein
MSDPRDYIVELGGRSDGQAEAPGPASGAGRPFLSVQFACCNVYTRIYRDRRGQCYRGRCPRCGRAVSFVVGEGGTDARCFIVR